MKSGMLAALAAGALVMTIFLAGVVAEAGTQVFAAIAMGAAAYATVHLILAAVRADARERAGT